jgi:ribonuclease Y
VPVYGLPGSPDARQTEIRVLRQNQLDHAVEVARLAAVIASELGANVEISKAAGLLHDLGKAMDHNMEGTHAMLGADFARRYGVNSVVVNAIASHHHEIEQESVEAAIAEAADAISGARPGARREALSNTSNGTCPEDLANSFKGVNRALHYKPGVSAHLRETGGYR